MMARIVTLLSLVLAGGLSAGCGSKSAGPADAPAPAARIVTAVPAQSARLTRLLRVTGSLLADEEAEVAAETAGRVTATPVERGSRVAEGSPLVSVVPIEAQAGAAEADANVAQLEARLAVVPGVAFDVEQVPEVATARALRDMAETDFNRIKSLLDQKVVSQAEFDQRSNQVEVTRNQYRTARNAAQQQYRMLEGARARSTLARKALADTTVRSPFAGLVVERKVSIGDFVTRGTKVATVVRVSPLRVELTVPEQSAGLIKAGQSLRLQVDGFPGRYFDGTVRFVSPAYRADQRALTVEAIVPNADDALKPGMFASAEIELPAEPSLVVPAEAIQTVAGVSHVFVIQGEKAEQRMITAGATIGQQTEIVNGVVAGELVAVSGAAGLVDGARVSVGGRPAAAGALPTPDPMKK